MTLPQSDHNIIYNIHIIDQMFFYAYRVTKTREKLIKLIDFVSTKPTLYQMLNCSLNAMATFNRQQTVCTQLVSWVIVLLPESMLDVYLVTEENHDIIYFWMIL